MLTPDQIARREAAKARTLHRRTMRARKRDTSYIPKLIASGVLG
jgi:hypothetical protein